MGFPFVHVCQLLEDLVDLYAQRPLPSTKTIKSKSYHVIEEWFSLHREAIKQADGVALLSALLPELRTDKVYCIQEKRLENIVATSDNMGSTRRQDLSRWREPGKGDLGDCVERALRQVDGSRFGAEVTVEDIEQATLAIASLKRFSSPAVRSLSRENSSSLGARDEPLIDLYRRLDSREAKWLTRLILKRYQPITVPENKVYYSYHPLLPNALKVQDHFSHAVKVIKQYEKDGGSDFFQYLRPEIGVKVGRQKFFQGRSIHNCLQMGGKRNMVVERKYDGEYVQIHIDLSKRQCIQLFSKSGKDSTQDRKKVHDTIMRCLGIGEPSCKIREKCILEGELLVYSDKDNMILPFHKIRKHVNRSGCFIGTGDDSQAHPYEHLCIMFFDILLLDDSSLLGLKHSERQKHLESVLHIVPGRADIVQRTTIDFASPRAAKELRKVFAKSITRNEEGLVVKPDEPYINLSGAFGGFKSCCIKMKKDAIGNHEIGDFAIVGANYNSAQAKKPEYVSIRQDLKYTEFLLGCLENREDVRRFEAKPKFVIVATVELSTVMMQNLMNHESLGVAHPYDSDEAQVFDIRTPKGIANGQPPHVVFTTPFVFDIKCFGFDREGNTGFETVRFPQVLKIHYDRTFMDCLTFEELQEKADEARTTPHDLEDIKKEREWIKKLVMADPKKVRELTEAFEETQESTQRTASTEGAASTQGTASPRRNESQKTESTEKSESTQRTTSTNFSETPREFLALSNYLSAPRASAYIPTPVLKPLSDEAKARVLRSVGIENGPILPQTARKSPPLESRTAPPGDEKTKSSMSKTSAEKVSDPANVTRKFRRSFPAAEFLPQSELARAVAEQDYDDFGMLVFGKPESRENSSRPHLMTSTSDTTGTLPRKRDDEQSSEVPSSTLTRKRENGQSPEVPSKKRRWTTTTLDVPSEKRLRASQGPISPPRRALSKASNMPSDRSSVANPNRPFGRDLTTAKSNVSAPYPTPPDETNDGRIINESPGQENSGARIPRDENAENIPPPAGITTPRRSVSNLNSLLTTSKPTATPPNNTPPPNPPTPHPPHLFLPPTTTPCHTTTPPNTCPLTRYTFLLSPCISSTPHIHALLQPHNRPYTTSLPTWFNTTLFPLYDPVTKKRLLRCVLVESHNTAETADVVLELREMIEKTGFRRSNGDREPIVVVDWRILEKVARMERGGVGVGEVGYCIWERFRSFGGFL